MRTRKHQSPVESPWVDKHKCEDAGQATSNVPAGNKAAVGDKERETNGASQYDSGDNLPNIDLKKINGKKQKRRRKSPKNKNLVPKVDCSLSGLMEDTVWLEKSVYEAAECAYYSKLAAAQAKALEAKTVTIQPELNGQQALKDSSKAMKRPAASNCCHNTNAACYHVENGIWVNKFSFDDAENQFVMRFQSPLVPRALDLSLVSHATGVTGSSPRTPDEGYKSATPTPATPGSRDLVALGAHASLSAMVPTDPTVNGKPRWAGLQDLIAEVWLEKPLYDHAETCFYETLALRQSAVKNEQPFHLNINSGKKCKRDKWNRKPAGKQSVGKKREFACIPEETFGRLAPSPEYYFLHKDSETVWLDKLDFEKAEAKYYYAAQTQNAQANNAESIVQLTRIAKTKHCAVPCDMK